MPPAICSTFLWNDIQQNIPLTSSGDSFETNAGNAKSYGAEFELRGRVTESLTAGLSRQLHPCDTRRRRPCRQHDPGRHRTRRDRSGVPRFNLDFDARQEFVVADEVNGFFTVDIPWVGQSHGASRSRQRRL
ncbi:MAG: hypothetical protein WDN04_08120 [Rhodospirillales bacterium]